MEKNKNLLLIALLFFCNYSFAIKIDANKIYNLNILSDSTKKQILTLATSDSSKPKSQINYRVPILVFGSGMLLISRSLKYAQTEWYNRKFRGNDGISIDNYLALVPNSMAIGLEFAKVKAKHNLKDRLLVAGIANSIVLGLTYGLKFTTRIVRPDNSNKTSFPSAHTAIAFTGAEIMHVEYGDQSIYYSVGSYAVGATTGYLRMVNNRHWVSDVVAGAGIGILSTRLAYRLLPWARKKVFKNENLTILPNYFPKGAGLAMNLTF
jgi:membrane-associated phospholipid phosphatase